jgi:hypothetical protein
MNSPQSVTATFTVAFLPGAPQNLIASPGSGSAFFTFSAPASDGGSPITSYTVTCTPGPLSASISGALSGTESIQLSGMTDGVTYTCSATATNGIGTGPPSASVQVMPVAFYLSGAVLRHQQGPFTSYDIPVDIFQPIGGAVTVEPRAIGTGHKVIFTFGGTITSTGTLACKDASSADVGSCSASMSANTVIVTIPSMPDGKRVRISLANVNGAGVTGAVSIAFLKGDVNGTRSVTACDILREKGRSGAVTGTTFVYDIDLGGTIDAADLAAVRANSGVSAP